MSLLEKYRDKKSFFKLNAISICYFKDSSYETPKKGTGHYHFVIPLKDNDAIIVAIITSEIEKFQKRYNDKGYTNCGEIITPEQFPFLDHSSLLDYHRAKIVDFNDLIDFDIKIIGLDNNFIKKIINQISISREVSDECKEICINLDLK